MHMNLAHFINLHMSSSPFRISLLANICDVYSAKGVILISFPFPPFASIDIFIAKHILTGPPFIVLAVQVQSSIALADKGTLM